MNFVYSFSVSLFDEPIFEIRGRSVQDLEFQNYLIEAPLKWKREIKILDKNRFQRETGEKGLSTRPEIFWVTWEKARKKKKKVSKN